MLFILTEIDKIRKMTSVFLKWMTTSFFPKWKSTSIYFSVEDDLNKIKNNNAPEIIKIKIMVVAPLRVT
jgi:hypothetical protein